MTEFGVFWIGLCIVVGCWFIGNGLMKIGEAIQEALEDESDLSGFYD